MEIQEHKQGAVTVLKPRGPVVGDDAKGLASRAHEVFKQTRGRFVLDASDIAFVDSAGLEALLDITELLAPSGQSLKLCQTNETVRETLNLTGLADEFEHYEDAHHAARSFL
ncbi:MAG: STAS domain-containing protein [Phycisphaerales bacterium]